MTLTGTMYVQVSWTLALQLGKYVMELLLGQAELHANAAGNVCVQGLACGEAFAVFAGLVRVLAVCKGPILSVSHAFCIVNLLANCDSTHTLLYTPFTPFSANV